MAQGECGGKLRGMNVGSNKYDVFAYEDMPRRLALDILDVAAAGSPLVWRTTRARQPGQLCEGFGIDVGCTARALTEFGFASGDDYLRRRCPPPPNLIGPARFATTITYGRHYRGGAATVTLPAESRLLPTGPGAFGGRLDSRQAGGENQPSFRREAWQMGSWIEDPKRPGGAITGATRKW